MTDARPSDTPRPDDGRPDPDRDAKIDELLLAGLDHHFGSRHQEAINVWERVLFLDRGHARARTYIDRARGALAERQRKTEELVHEGVAALDRGDGRAARRLLASAVENGDPHDLAHAYLDRLDRLTAPPTSPGQDPGPARSSATPDDLATRGLLTRAPRPVRVWPILAAAVTIGAVILFAASGDLLKPLVDREWRQPPAGAAVSLAPDPVLAPRPAEVALARARDLFRSGHLKPALAVLDSVSVADPLAPEALRLRADLQRMLLGPLDVAGVEPGQAPATPAMPSARPAEVRQ
jgi:hypothetical protein